MNNDKCFQGSSVAASYTISTMKVMAGGVLSLTDDVMYNLELTTLQVAPSGTIKAARLTVSATTLLVEEGGIIDLSEKGDNGLGQGTLHFWTFIHHFNP